MENKTQAEEREEEKKNIARKRVWGRVVRNNSKLSVV